MNQFQLNGKEILAVRVPSGTYNHTIKWYDNDDRFHIDYLFAENHRGGFIMWFKDFGSKKNYPKRNSLKIIGLTSEIVKDEAKCAELVETVGVRAFKNYLDNELWFCEAVHSFHSLLQREKMFFVNPYPKPFPHPMDSFNDSIEYEGAMIEYEAMQDLVGERLLLEKIR